MREILFRAKDKDNGEWVYGYYAHFETIREVLYVIYTDCVDDYSVGLLANYSDVKPETVGQYTGLTDKNGTKIFEKDILSAHLDNAYPEDETLLEVIWHNNGWYGKNEPFFEDFDNGFEKHFEVIGNVHDNPELLQD